MTCGMKNEVDSFSGSTCRAEAFFADLPVDAIMVLWGAGGIYYKLMRQYRDLFSDRFVLVDANPEQHGLHICGKCIHPPEFIVLNNITTVIITALSRKDEICETLRIHYSSVKTVLFPSWKRTGEKVVPVLQPHLAAESRESSK